MSLPKITLDGADCMPDIPESINLALFVSLIDRALLRECRRVVKVESNSGINLFNPESFLLDLHSFDSIKMTSAPIPDNLKTAVVTLVIGEDYNDMSEISTPTFREYAKKIGAEFLIISEARLNMLSLLFEKWQMFYLLFEYDRLLFVDADILIAPDSPNLFEKVPIGEVGGFVEDDYDDRSKMINHPQSVFGDLGWRKGYLNAGFGVYDWIHRPVFTKTDTYVYSLGDQNMYNYRIQQMKFDICPLPKEYNYMGICGDNRLSAYFIHYAGHSFVGHMEKQQQFKAKVELMRQDLQWLQQNRT